MQIPNVLETIRAEIPRYSFTDYLRQLKSAEDAAANTAPLRVAILRSYTVEPIDPVLRVRLMVDGYLPTLWFGGYNQYAQEILDPASGLYQFKPDVALMLLRIEELVPEFITDFPGKTSAEWMSVLDAKAKEIASLVDRFGKTCAAPVLIQNMTLASGAYFGIFDSQRPDGQRSLIERFNQALSVALADRAGAFIWDFDAFVHMKGAENIYDPKAWYVSRNPFKQAAYPAIVDDLLRYIESGLGRMKKCVVLDLDNTLWGGVVGEDGIEGIALGHAYPGNCYRDFQQELLKLSQRGILLAINSKNNEEDALRVINEHPDMVLRRHHFAAVRINWQDKAGNLRDLARELNIGVDSMIFVDDSPVECDLIRQQCPECDVVLLPDKPYLLPSVAAGLSGTQNIRLTVEDSQKAEMYRARAARKEQQNSYSDLDEFLRGLDIEVSVQPAVPFSIPRIAQLTQKTNQLNMTTRRYTEAQVEGFASDPAFAVFSVASRDRFGDEGIVGVIILKFSDDECRIDTFLLSCRVIGRGIERLMLAVIGETARDRGARRVVAEFIPTAKNQPAAGIYEKAGFQRLDDRTFEAGVPDTTFPRPEHIRLSVSV